jgi:hypothetical protein
MKRVTFAVLAAFMTLPLAAQESPEEVVKRLAELGEGVHEVKAENGRLRSLKIVGQERISTVLGPEKGLMTAQKRASMKANAAFVEWMGSNVSSISTSGEETVVVVTGDGQGVTEQGKSSETTRREIVTKAEGLVRGLSLVGKDQDPDSKLLTLVFSWSPERAALSDEARTANREPSRPIPSQPAVDGGSIPRKTIVSPDFDN